MRRKARACGETKRSGTFARRAQRREAQTPRADYRMVAQGASAINRHLK
jgi:hypothetical protein